MSCVSGHDSTVNGTESAMTAHTSDSAQQIKSITVLLGAKNEKQQSNGALLTLF